MIGAARRRVHELGRRLLRQHSSPGRLAAAVFVGCLVGCSPFYGLHLPICVLLAALFGLNQIAVYGAANLSIPPLAPLIGFSSVQLGERIVRGHWLALRLEDITLRSAPGFALRFFQSWLVGGLLVGAGVGLIAAPVVYVIARRRRRARPAQANQEIAERIDAAIEAARRRYDAAPHRHKWYARMKYRLDPCYRSIAAHIAPGERVVDLGTGLGMLPVVIGLLGEGRTALGVEWDADKVRSGLIAAQGLAGVALQAGDARAFELPPCDVVTLVDVLHYYDAGEQRALIARVASRLAPGGRLLVREGDAERKGGAGLTRAIERLVTLLGWNKGPSVRFRPVPELVADLEGAGFRTTVDDVAGDLHPGNVLLTGVRK